VNIFALHPDPLVAAKSQCDKHVVKMVLETAQLLSTAHRLSPLPGHSELPGVEALYKATHKNHPCAVWARATSGNYMWLERHLQGLLHEYTYRYGRTHKTERTVLPILLALPIPAPAGPRTPFAQAMPEEYQSEDPVASYRAYYRGAKADIARWSHTKPPSWWASESIRSEGALLSAGGRLQSDQARRG